MLGPLLFVLYTTKIFEQVENSLFAYADDSTLLEVVSKPANRPAVAATLNPAYLAIFFHGFTSGWGKTPQR